MKSAPLLIALLALAVACVALFRPAPSAPQQGELAYSMAYLQRYADKLYFAGTAGNRALAGFYLHEIEETAEALVGAGHVEDGVDVSGLVEAMLLPAVERLEAAVASGDTTRFAGEYRMLVQTCNGCHTASRHGFIQITVPTQTGYPNQRYAP